MKGSNSFTGDLFICKEDGSSDLLKIVTDSNLLEFGQSSTIRMLILNDTANTIQIGRTHPGSLIVNSDLTVQGTTRYANTTNLNVSDKNITANVGGTTNKENMYKYYHICNRYEKWKHYINL